VLPQHPLSRVVHGLSRLRAGPLTRLGIRAYAHGFGVDLRDAAMSDLADYPTFNAFFTRALRADARPLDPRGNTLLCPVDGTVSQLGRLSGGRLVQAKGHDFDATELLGGDAALAAPFTDGSFATLYLSPRDYHRIHMPLTGALTTALHVPGRLFSVNATTAARVPRLYARNERVACLFDTAAGPLAVVLVGAIFVGSIETIWHGEITPPRGRRVRPLPSPSSVPVLERGAELGRFNLGSTVILLLPADAAAWRRDLKPGRAVRMGEALGRLEARR
jgi:phosphatidylserine decarboxylase